MSQPSNGFGVGDVIHNGWAGSKNCYHIIVGHGSINSSIFSKTSIYKMRMLYEGKLSKHISQMDTRAERQTKRLTRD